MSRRLGDDDFERRTHVRLGEVSGERAAVASTEYEVNVQRRFALLADADVAHQRCDLDLFVHRNVDVLLAVPVEVAQHRVAEGADRGEPRRRQLLLSRQRLQRRHRLVARFEHGNEDALSVGFVNQPAHHFSLSAEGLRDRPCRRRVFDRSGETP